MTEVVAIPGGEAVMISKSSELTARRRRPIEIVSSRIGKKVAEISNAARLICDGDVVLDQSKVLLEDGTPKFTGGDVQVTERELGLVMRLNDVIAFALLKSWTIDHPFPTSPDEYADIPVDVYDALRVHAARLNAGLRDQQAAFTVDAVEDPGSPTGG